ncbi:MAG: tetratricopeptide repeat protein, partial [Myxococcales bacterium]
MRQRIFTPLLCTAVVLVLLGCPKRVGSQSGDGGDPVLAEKLEEARRKAEAGDEQGARALLEEIGRQEDPAAADALFALGEAKFRAKDYAGARTDFRALLERFPLHGRAETARLHLGMSQLELK